MGWWMFFDTFWALVFGFTLSGVIQALISKDRMRKSLGDHTAKSVMKASFFGSVSSSCSYAATALSKTLFFKGADFTTSMIFAFASTNLVIELGIVIWILIGWQFAIAEFLGGAVMIILLRLLLPRLMPAHLIDGLRDGSTSSESLPDDGEFQKARLSDAAGYTIGDFTMMRFELMIGFLIAGMATAIIPISFWQRLFFTGHGFLSTLENVVVSPVIAFLSFVCSVGNVPLAAALWHNGISFGGTIAFIYADLIALPLVLIYRKYYGTKIAVRLTLIFWFVMSLTGLITQYLFSIFSVVPEKHGLKLVQSRIGVNVTTILNLLALVLCFVVVFLYKQGRRGDSGSSENNSEFAKDLVCGMQVRKADAAARYEHNGRTFYFCMDGCRDSFAKEPAKYLIK
jgi:uncharacterized membrane protein YraQ (UPF0718 family)/YHS domain-containing protein